MMPLTRFPHPFQDRAGNAIVGATVTITKWSNGNPVELYTDALGASPVGSNTAVTDADGEINVYLSPDIVDVSVTKAGQTLLAATGIEVVGVTVMVYADDYGSLTKAIQKAQTYELLGAGVWLTPGKQYSRTEKLAIPSACGLVSDGTARIYAPAGSFDNATLGTRYSSNSCVIDMSGLTSGAFTRAQAPFLIGVEIVSESATGRAVDAIVARNVERLRIENVTVRGFPTGADLRLASLVGGIVRGVNCGNRTDDYDWPTQPQMTGICVDQDRIDGRGSSNTRFSDNFIREILATGDYLASWGQESDGVNISHQSSVLLTFTNTTINEVGEGIDCFGKHIAFNGVTMSNIRAAGIKFVHGASFCSVNGGALVNVGRYGVVFSGSDIEDVGDTTRNVINGLTVTNVDYLGAHAASNTACIGFEDNGGSEGLPVGNIVNGAALSCGDEGQYGWYDESNGSGNIGEAISIAVGGNTTKRVRVDNAAGSCRLVGSSTYHTDLT